MKRLNAPIGARLKSERKRLGFTQKTLHTHLGVHAHTIGYWERGSAMPSDKLAKLDELGFDTQYIITGRGNSTVKTEIADKTDKTNRVKLPQHAIDHINKNPTKTKLLRKMILILCHGRPAELLEDNVIYQFVAGVTPDFSVSREQVTSQIDELVYLGVLCQKREGDLRFSTTAISAYSIRAGTYALAGLDLPPRPTDQLHESIRPFGSEKNGLTGATL